MCLQICFDEQSVYQRKKKKVKRTKPATFAEALYLTLQKREKGFLCINSLIQLHEG